MGPNLATYTKFNPKHSRYYSGRTSMVANLEKPLRPQAVSAVNERDSNHHVDENNQRGVAKENPLGRLFHDSATKRWGQLHPYTGD